MQVKDVRNWNPDGLRKRIERIEIVIEFSNPVDAYRASWYPGVRRDGPRAVAFASDDYFEILRAYRFMKS